MPSEAQRRQMIDSFADKQYRDDYAAAFVVRGMAFQIREMRKARGWTQRQLAERAGMIQETITALENPDREHGYTTTTLLRLASAFDVALIVRFAPFETLANGAGDLVVPSFAASHPTGATDAEGEDDA